MSSFGGFLLLFTHRFPGGASQAIAKEELTKYIIEHYKVASIAVENEAGEYCKIPSEDIGKYTPHFLNPSFSSKSLFDLEKCGDQELAEAELISKTASLHTAGGVQVAVAPIIAVGVVGALSVGSGCSIGMMQAHYSPNKSSADVAVDTGAFTGAVGFTSAIIASVFMGDTFSALAVKVAPATRAGLILGTMFAVVCNKVTLFLQKD